MDNMRSSDWELSKEEVKRLDKLSEPVKIYPHWYFEIFRKGQLNKLGV
jgi:diketogulonate reductase-like aldo/keto reductase